MYIEQVELKNIGPHRHLQVNLGRGFIGIVGPNGSGKSTVVNAIYAALTNDFSRFGVIKADIINNVCGNEQSYIRIQGRHQGQDFTLTRWLRPGKNEFKIGDREYSKANEINEAILQELSVNKAVIDRYVFVAQWEMFSFLNDSESERAKAFQHLCGIEVATQIHKACSDFVDRQPKFEIIDNSLELEAAIEEYSNSIRQHQKEQAEAENRIPSKERIESLQKQIGDHEAAIEAQQHLPIVGAALTAKRKTIKKHTDKLEAINTRLSSIQATLAALEPDYHNAVAALQTEKGRSEAEASLNLALNSLAQAEEELQKCKDPAPKLKKYVQPAERQRLADEVLKLEAVVSTATEVDLQQDVCEYCKQEISHDHKVFLQQDLEKNTELLEVYREKLAYSERYDRREDSRARREVHCKNQIAQQKKAAAQAKAILDKLGSSDAFKHNEVIRDYRNWTSLAKNCATEKESCTEDISLLWQSLARIKEKQKQFESVCSRLQDATTIQSFVDELAEASQAKTDRDMAIGKNLAARASRKKAKELLQQLREKLAERAKAQKFLADISRVAQAFHWNQLPKAVAQANLNLLIDDINANLDRFNSPFSVETDDDLTFKVFFPGHPAVKAKQLSGGQKAVLAVAFRAALDRVFGHDVGMMFLDEPTAGLDVDNINYFHEALQAMAKNVGDEKQLVVITHVHELSNSFDQLVELSVQND